MSVSHIVLVNFKEDADPQACENVLKELESLREIPFVRSIKYGKNFADRSKGFTHGFIVEVETKEQVQEYAQHEIHLKYVPKLLALVKDVLALDFENESIGA